MRMRVWIGLTLLAAMLASAPAWSERTYQLIFNGRTLSTRAVEVNSRIYVPVLPLASAMKLAVQWDPAKNVVTLNGKTVQAQPLLRKGVLLLPLDRFAATAGAALAWDRPNGRVRLNLQKPVAVAPPPILPPVRPVPPPPAPVMTPLPRVSPVPPPPLPWPTVTPQPVPTMPPMYAPDPPGNDPNRWTAPGTPDPPQVQPPSWGHGYSGPQAQLPPYIIPPYSQGTTAPRPSSPPAPDITPYQGPYTAIPTPHIEPSSPPPRIETTPGPAVPDAYIPRTAANGVFSVTVTNVQPATSFREAYRPRAGARFVIVYLSMQNVSGVIQPYHGKFMLEDSRGVGHPPLDGLSNWFNLVLRPLGTNFGYLTYEVPDNAVPARLVLQSNGPQLSIQL